MFNNVESFPKNRLKKNYLGLFQKGPVFPISFIVATISRAYSRFLETQLRSIRLRKYGPEKSLTRSGRGIIPSVVVGSNLAQFLMCSSDRKRFIVLHALGMSWNHFQKGTATYPTRSLGSTLRMTPSRTSTCMDSPQSRQGALMRTVLLGKSQQTASDSNPHWPNHFC